MSTMPYRTIESLAHALYLNTARDADFPRRDRGRAALDAWRRARSTDERAAAAHLVLNAAHCYGLRPARDQR